MIGLLARAESRGLGTLTWEVARHLDPKVLVIDVHRGADGYPPHYDRYPGATRVRWRGQLPEAEMRTWLDGLSVLYTAETFYDPRVAGWAREAGVATVLHTMPEFYRDHENVPDVWWAPTSWRLDHLPAGTRVVPVPVAADRFTPAAPHGGPCRWVHVAGKRTVGDRNGTAAVCAAIPHLRAACSVTVVRQDPGIRVPIRPSRRVDVRVVDGAADYWQLYADTDALVLPRRYGGLSLVAQEAMGAGLAVLMPDCPPNPQTWPVATVKARPGERHRMPAGVIEAADVNPAELAAEMDRFADPVYRAEHQDAARAWADAHSWERWTDRYRALLAEVVA